MLPAAKRYTAHAVVLTKTLSHCRCGSNSTTAFGVYKKMAAKSLERGSKWASDCMHANVSLIEILPSGTTPPISLSGISCHQKSIDFCCHACLWHTAGSPPLPNTFRRLWHRYLASPLFLRCRKGDLKRLEGSPCQLITSVAGTHRTVCSSIAPGPTT